MKARDALERFKEFARHAGKSLASLSPTEAIDLMVAFYTKVRADECDIDADGDMLLFQWGTYKWGTEEYFEYNITRQLLFPSSALENDDECIWQLSPTLKFKPILELKGLSAGNKWCENPGKVVDFVHFITLCEVSQRIKIYSPEAVELTFESVE